MSRMPQAIDQIKGYKWGAIPHLKEIEQYPLAGDEDALATIQKSSNNPWFVANSLLAALPAPGALDDMDRRALHVLWQLGHQQTIGGWLEQHLSREKPDEDFHSVVRAALEGVKATKTQIADFTGRFVHTFARAGQPTSAGRYILALSDKELGHAVVNPATEAVRLPVIEFVAAAAPDRLEPLLADVLNPNSQWNQWMAAAALVRKCGRRFETQAAAFARAAPVAWQRFQVGRALAELDPHERRAAAVEAARACLADGNQNTDAAGWLLEALGADAVPDVVAFMGGKHSSYAKMQILTPAVQALGRAALPAVLAAVNAGDAHLTPQALPHLVRLDDGTHDALSQAELEKGLAAKDARQLGQFLGIAARWKVGPLAPRLWELLGHSARGARDGAARALGTLGDVAVPKARELLEQGRNVPARLAAVGVLTAANTPAALKVLEDRLDEEASDDVRDAMLVGLEAAWAAAGRQVTRKDVEARVARAEPRLKSPPAPWLDEAKLPPLYYKAGEQLDAKTVRYLLYRQSRAQEMRPDVEARALYDLIDHGRSADFAQAVLTAYLTTGGHSNARWAMTVAGLLGDDRIAAPLASQIRQWADGTRAKMAEYAVQALALQGGDAALLTIDAVAQRYRTKKKAVGEAAGEAFRAAAERQGITPDELGDRVVPWLGFEPGQPRVIDCGGRRLEVRISPDFKLKYHDLDKNKPVATLPKTAPKEVQAELKAAGALLREVVKAQLARLENLIVRQQRWPAARWRELFLSHPVLLPFAVRLVWGAYDAKGQRVGLFRALEDRTLTDTNDDAFELPDHCTVGAVHPSELTEDERAMWQVHLADYEIEPPFPQMERPVVRLKDSDRDVKLVTSHRGAKVNGMTFRGRAERLGWFRGEGADGGSINVFWKSFATAGVDGLIGLEGMYFGMSMEDEVRVEDVCFVRPEAGKGRSYSYLPHNEGDERLVALKDVPPVVYSEVMGDLQKLTGRSNADAAG